MNPSRGEVNADDRTDASGGAPASDPGDQARVGVEVHVQLATGRKLFCPCRPGTVCEVCRGEPGTMPIADAHAIRLGVRAAQALGARVHPVSTWARKHYDWPDLPKGYQRTQGRVPLAEGGAVAGLPLARVHLEEDAGRIVKDTVDDGRAGIALLEIVSHPVELSPQALEDALGWLHRILVTTGVTEGRIEAGQWRVDLNVSLPDGARVEVKNVGGIGSVGRALRAEVQRQEALRARGAPVTEETRAWDGHATRPLRGRRAHRWLGEADLPPLDARAALDAEAQGRGVEPVERALRAADDDHLARLGREGISAHAAGALRADPSRWALYCDAVARGARPRTVADLLHRLERRGARDLPSGESCARACAALDAEHASRDAIVDALLHPGEAPAPWEVAVPMEAPDVLERVVHAILAEEDALVRRYDAGERALEGHFVGRAMHATGRRLPPRRVVEAVRAALSARYAGRSEER